MFCNKRTITEKKELIQLKRSLDDQYVLQDKYMFFEYIDKKYLKSSAINSHILLMSIRGEILNEVKDLIIEFKIQEDGKIFTKIVILTNLILDYKYPAEDYLSKCITNKYAFLYDAERLLCLTPISESVK